jgi:hypothetical protein
VKGSRAAISSERGCPISRALFAREVGPFRPGWPSLLILRPLLAQWVPRSLRSPLSFTKAAILNV